MNIKDWFGSLQARERYLLVGGSLVLLLLALYILFWEPLGNQVDKLRKQDAAMASQLNWMHSAQAEIRNLKGNTRTPSIDLRTSLISAVERTANARGIRGQVKRMEPQGRGKISVEFTGVGFDQLTQWLGQLESGYGAKTTQFHSTQSDKPGRVDARVILTRETP
ncbi:MAG: type II secretion system protein GspM [bacterium]